MRAPSLRVAAIALAAVAVFAGGTLATQDGPMGGDGGSAGGATTSAAASDGVTSPAPLGTMSERLARLAPVPPGELAGTLHFADDAGCWQLTIDLATLMRSTPPGGVCFATGGRRGVYDLYDDPRPTRVVDLDGRTTETIAVPDGWGLWTIARDGLVFCNYFLAGPARIWRFGRAWAPLPDCPVAKGQDGLLFAGPRRRSIVDERGRRVAALTEPLGEFARIRPIGDALLAVDSRLYGDGRLLASYQEPGAIVLGASRDAGVALISVGPRLIIYRDGTAHPIDSSVATRGGVVSPDGTLLLVQHDQEVLIVLDAATLRPLARLPINAYASLRDWRS